MPASPTARLEQIARRRAKAERDRAQLATDTAAAIREARDAGVPMTDIARALGVSRQGAYDFLEQVDR